MIVRTYQSEVRRLFTKPVATPDPKPARILRRWSDEEMDTLARLRADGLSFGRIARKLGRTRNSVAGMVYRGRHG